MWLCGWVTCPETPRHTLLAQNPSCQGHEIFTQHFSTDLHWIKTPTITTPVVTKLIGAKCVHRRYVIDSKTCQLSIGWLVWRSNAWCEPAETLWVQSPHYCCPFKPILSDENARGKVLPVFLPTLFDSVAEPPDPKHHDTPSLLRILHVRDMKLSHSTSQLICIEIKTPTTSTPAVSKFVSAKSVQRKEMIDSETC